MEIFYATFMGKQLFKNAYIEIEAASVELARGFMFNHFGKEWMTVYDEKGFEGQINRFNLKRLLKVAVIDHGSSLEYVNIDGKEGALESLSEAISFGFGNYTEEQKSKFEKALNYFHKTF